MLTPGRRSERAADGRRHAGDLESAVLAVLWEAKNPMAPNDVQTALADGLTYSTVVTILVRLHRKGLVERRRLGRAFVYEPVVSEADIVSAQIRRMFEASTSRTTVLQGFLAGLDPADESELREMLDPPNDTAG